MLFPSSVLLFLQAQQREENLESFVLFLQQKKGVDLFHFFCPKISVCLPTWYNICLWCIPIKSINCYVGSTTREERNMQAGCCSPQEGAIAPS